MIEQFPPGLWAMMPDRMRAAMDTDIDLTGVDLEMMAAARQAGPKMEAGAVAVIRIAGTLRQKPNPFAFLFSSASTEEISLMVRNAISNPEVKSIILDIDSPGGQVEGVQELATEILAARKVKPIVASINALAGSAAFWLAAQASQIAITPSGSAGSIGVFMLHFDISEMVANEGVKPTFIFAGERKTEGNEFEPLAEDALAHFQAQVDITNAAFVAAVAKGRGVSTGRVNANFGQGRVFMAEESVRRGLADVVMSFAQVAEKMMAGKLPAAGVGMRAETVESQDADAAMDAEVDMCFRVFDAIKAAKQPGDGSPVKAESVTTDDAGDLDIRRRRIEIIEQGG